MRGFIFISAGAFPFSNWVAPGNKKPGYWYENDMISMTWPDLANSLERARLKLAMPPRRGKAGPILSTFNSNQLIFSAIRYSFRSDEFLDIISPRKPARNNWDPIIIAVSAI